MQINIINLELLDDDTVTAMQLDSRINFALDTCFVLSKDKQTIEDTYEVRIDDGTYVFFESSPHQTKYNFDFDSLNMFRNDISLNSENEELFYSYFPAWLKKLERTFENNLEWCM